MGDTEVPNVKGNVFIIEMNLALIIFWRVKMPVIRIHFFKIQMQFAPIIIRILEMCFIRMHCLESQSPEITLEYLSINLKHTTLTQSTSHIPNTEYLIPQTPPHTCFAV